MNIPYEWAAIGLLSALCLLLVYLVHKLGQRVRQISQSQKALIQQSDAVHRAQMAYAETTEEAMSYLRDGLQSLTTVSANLDMKSYALELQQARMGQRMKTQDLIRQKVAPFAAGVSGITTQQKRAPAAKAADEVVEPVKKMTATSSPSVTRPLSQAERDLMNAIAPKHAQPA